MGYYKGTGTSYMSGQLIVLPADQMVLTDSGNVTALIRENMPNPNKYGEGYNCVEYALELSRIAEWKGIPSEIVRIDFEDSNISHLVVAFPTSDKGWIFLDWKSVV